MKIFEIDAEIERLIEDSVDPETGESNLDFDAVESLQMERAKAVENLALYYKNLCAEAEAIEAEEKNLAKRRKVTENAAERVRGYLEYVLKGERFKSPRVIVSYRNTPSVSLDDEVFMAWAAENSPSLIRTTVKTEPDKAAIKDALRNGEDIKGAALVIKTTLNVR